MVLTRLTTPLWAVVVLGATLGALVGGFQLERATPSEAVALIRVFQPIDPDQIMTGATGSTDNQQSYISGEVGYLNSPGFAAAVGKELNGMAQAVTVAQDAQSPILEVSATGPNYAAAERIVGGALTAYSNHIAQQTRERGQAAINALNNVIDPLQQEVVALEQQYAQLWSPTDADASTIADKRARIQKLEEQRVAIEVQMQRPQYFQTVQSPTKTPAKGAPGWMLGALAGGLLGAFAALGAALGWRVRSGVVVSAAALTGRIERVLVPAVRLSTMEGTADDIGLARSLYAQLPAPRSGRILVVGASADSGTEDVAALIAQAAGEHSDVRVERLQSVDHRPTWPGWINDPLEGVTVINGGSVDASPALPEAADAASQIIVVAMIGRDTVDGVTTAGQLAQHTDVPVSAVLTRGKLLGNRSAQRQRSRARHAAADRQVAGSHIGNQVERDDESAAADASWPELAGAEFTPPARADDSGQP